MAITADWQAEIQATAGAYLLGDTTGATGSRIRPEEGSIQKVSALREESSPRIGDHGSAPALERYDRTTITIPVEWYSTTAALVEAEVQLARAGWGTFEGDDNTLIRLDIREPGTPETVMAYFGKPRPLAVNARLHRFARKTGVATFVAHDALAYGAEVGPANYAASPATPSNAGDIATRRVTIAVNGNGGTPVLTSTTDSSGDITFNSTVAGGTTITIDLYAETAVDGSSVDQLDKISPTSTWFRLLPGSNSITFSGCASLDITHRPAWVPTG